MAMLLENMQVYVRVVELGSLSAAGRHLRLSPAVVSHRLQQLENHLGVRLLNRTTRQVQPTEQGAAYYEACQEVLAALAHAESVVAETGGTPKGSLRVTAPLGLGRRILAPLIPGFIARYPQLDVRLRLSDHLLDLLREAVDVAIRLAVLAELEPDRAQDRRVPAPVVRRTRLSRRQGYAQRGLRTCSTISACSCAFPARSNSAGPCPRRTAPKPSRWRAEWTLTTAMCSPNGRCSARASCSSRHSKSPNICATVG